ncbi:MAG: putative hydro-lyase [Geminicoccaceae bacterium]
MTANGLLECPIADIRQSIRAGDYRGQTAGFAPGKLQANLVVLEGRFANHFLEFCHNNPKPCPLVGLSKPGNPRMPGLGDIDIRTDVPSYNIYRDGLLAESVHEIGDLWTDGMVAFALGCSFTFEGALMADGIPMKHIEANTTVSMYKTNLALVESGPFNGTMVVSMRPIPSERVSEAIAITSRFDHAHGTPVHVGDGDKIGIGELDAPDWGEPARFEPDDVPVFWACGVTPQNVLEAACPPLCITHTPGRMLITDHPEDRAPELTV